MDERKNKKVLMMVIVFMILVLLLLCGALVFGVRHVNRVYPTTFSSFLAARRARGPLPMTEADLVRSWMTFDYINQLFGLPQNYLKSVLSISDTRYPKLSLSEFEESVSTTSATFLQNVREAISSYSTSTSQ